MGPRVSLRSLVFSIMPLYGDGDLITIKFIQAVVECSLLPTITGNRSCPMGAVFGSNVRTVCLQMLLHQCTCGGCRVPFLRPRCPRSLLRTSLLFCGACTDCPRSSNLEDDRCMDKSKKSQENSQKQASTDTRIRRVQKEAKDPKP
ncbi:hypothetical protein Tco_1550580 [Tanacetum coccineum]